MVLIREMQRIDNIKRAAAEIYWQIQEEITNSTLMEYMYHDVRLESNSNLPKWVGKKILSKKVVNRKRFQSKDILLAQNPHRAIAFVRRMADIPKYDITENDIKNQYLWYLVLLGSIVLIILIPLQNGLIFRNI